MRIISWLAAWVTSTLAGGMIGFTCIFGANQEVSEQLINATLGAVSSKTQVYDSKYESYRYDLLYIKVDRPHPALHIIHAPHGLLFVPMNAAKYTYSVTGEEQRCVKVHPSGWENETFDVLTAWTATDVPDVAILLASRFYFANISAEKYNGTNFAWFRNRAVGAAKGANNNVTVFRELLPKEPGIFVCNPLNSSALFDVVIIGEKGKYKANGTGTEWVGQKSMSVAPSDTANETIIAQYEFDEPCNETLRATVRVVGRQIGAVIVFIVQGSLALVAVLSFVFAALVCWAPRWTLGVLTGRSGNNWQNIPDGKLTALKV